MKIERTKNAVRNIFFGTLYKMISILLPFTTRTAMIYVMGSEYVGLSSLFSSILSFLSLAELGIGSAIVFSMYKPIAEDDRDTICALLNLYKRLYRYIGSIILSIGLLLIPFLRYIVKGGCPSDVNFYILYGIYLFNTVISYWLFGYKQSLLSAFQRNDIISKRSMILDTLLYTFQIIALILSRNYYIYIIWLPIFTIVKNVVNSLIVDKMYPDYKCIGEIDKSLKISIQKKTIALFGTKANSIVMHAADNLVISAFLGLRMVGKYGNYYCIINYVTGFLSIIYSSLTAGLGNSLVVESVEKNYKDFEVLNFINSWIVMFCTTCLLCLYQPFMRIWVHEPLMLDNYVVFLLVVYFYIYSIRRLGLTYKDAKGIWWEDRFRPYVMMIVNVIGNIYMVQIIGIYGVVLSTIFGMLVAFPWETYTIFKYIFNRSAKQYYKKMGVYTVVTVIIAVITFLICNTFGDTAMDIILRLIICAIVPNILFVGFFYRKHEFKESIKKIASYRKRNL